MCATVYILPGPLRKQFHPGEFYPPSSTSLRTLQDVHRDCASSILSTKLLTTRRRQAGLQRVLAGYSMRLDTGRIASNNFATAVERASCWVSARSAQPVRTKCADRLRLVNGIPGIVTVPAWAFVETMSAYLRRRLFAAHDVMDRVDEEELVRFVARLLLFALVAPVLAERDRDVAA